MPRRRDSEKNAPGRYKAGYVVDVAVRLHIGKFAGKPENRLRTGKPAQGLRDFFARAARVPIAVQQTLFRRDERAVPIDMNGTALADDRRGKQFGAGALQYARGESRI